MYLARLGTVGKVAHLHLAFIEAHGKMTVHDSREVRRPLYPTEEKMRSTANMFGREHSGAILWRAVPYKTKLRANQEIRLTTEGERMAKLYRQVHGL